MQLPSVRTVLSRGATLVLFGVLAALFVFGSLWWGAWGLREILSAVVVSLLFLGAYFVVIFLSDALRSLGALVLVPLFLTIVFTALFPHFFMRFGMLVNANIYSVCHGADLNPVTNLHNIYLSVWVCVLLSFLGSLTLGTFSSIYVVHFFLLLLVVLYISREVFGGRVLPILLTTLVALDPFLQTSYISLEYSVLALPFVVLSLFYLYRSDLGISAVFAALASLSRPELALVFVPIFFFAYIFRRPHIPRHSFATFVASFFVLSAVALSSIYWSVVHWDPNVFGTPQNPGDVGFLRVIFDRLSFTLPDSAATLAKYAPHTLLFALFAIFFPLVALFLLGVYVMYNAHIDTLAAIHYHSITGGFAGVMKYAAMFSIPSAIFGVFALFYTIHRTRFARNANVILGILLTSMVIYGAANYVNPTSPPLTTASLARAWLDANSPYVRAVAVHWDNNSPIVLSDSGSGLFLGNVPYPRARLFSSYELHGVTDMCGFIRKACGVSCYAYGPISLYTTSQDDINTFISIATTCGYSATVLETTPRIVLLTTRSNQRIKTSGDN
ncbi:MAG: hypothetical protein GXN93_03950 [Candidatus Diapherotrites archaeon]|nr:hypothetical protein [Candidatus Diapherotrites archaeon]